MISSLIIPTYALGNRIISIKDLRTNNAISNAYTTIFDIKSGKSYDYISDDNGCIDIPLSDYNELNNQFIYISAHNDEYYGSYSTNIINEVLYIEEDSSFEKHKSSISNYSATDWNIISSSYVEDIYVPIAQVATYGGLKAGIKFESSYTWSISGSSILGSGTYSSSGFSGRKITNLCSTNSPKWMNIFGLYARYKVVEVYPATGEKRTRYFIAGKCLELKNEYSTRTTGTTVSTNQREIVFNKNTVYAEQTFGSSTNYSFSFSGTLKTSNNKSYTTKVTVMMKLSGGNSITYIYSVPKAVNRKYTIGFNKIQIN